MSDRHGSAIFACVLAALLGQAVNAQTVQHISDTLPRMTEELPFQAQYPIARELRFTVYRQMFLNGEPQQPVFATNENADGVAAYAIPAITMPAAGPEATPLTEFYERRQAEARADGDRVMEAHYRELSHNALQSEVAAGRLNAQIGLMQASLGALAALGQALMDANAQALADWVIQTTAAVGPSAEEGSILHLGFFEYVHSARFSVESRLELVVTATLESAGDEDTMQSARSLELFTYRRRNREAANVRPGYIVLDDALKRASLQKVNARRLNGIPFGIQHAIAANSAIAALYRQHEDSDGMP